MTATTAPSREDIVRRAAEVVPTIAKHAAWADDNRRLHEDTIDAIVGAGLLKLRVAHRYGGYQANMRTVVDTITEVGRGDGSAAWTTAVWTICSWLVGLFPDEAQDEVFATPDARVCGLLSPGGAGTPVDGGLLVSGQWAFNTGASQSDWNSLVVVAPGPDGEMWPVMTLVPTKELQIVDDWHTVGLRGTASVTTAVRDLYVPQHRILPLAPVLQEQYASQLNADVPIFRVPMLLTAATTTAGTALGLVKAARDAFFERLPGRKITYTSYDSQRAAPLTHLQVAEAALKIDEAEFHVYRAADLLDDKGVSGEAWSVVERAQVRADLGRAVQLAKEATDIYRNASGASSIYQHVPIQRIARDMEALSLHAILHPNTNYELYGRILCGLEPNTFYI
ncbi:acyl-CoA dehydrogenase family protein [Micromonospora sp. NBC_01813]|uniref:acyl-CoA dehydrogenase family protein n=1 Tax=Micromonospora sp. NBC_01813 TaxID=2975988 RepID=UPI002DDBF0A1|nr:acyl-CoA dehydrogenase family protein [Micromonospora sp. NBC_01813]WSA08760.1 acyl-CoA dehydrogenase [Micromonospora sp. NBC_01813]